MSNIEDAVANVARGYFDGDYYNYIEQEIVPEYKSDKGHGWSHICDVINRAFELNENLGLGLDLKMLSAGVFYHDIGRKIDDETHEIISAQIFMDDEGMKKFFTDEERGIIREAIEDHRASLEGEPRNVYGKLISSADRNTNLEQPLRRTYEYRRERNPEMSLEEKIKDSFKHLKEKFGKEGYAGSVYFDDGSYKKYLDDLRALLDNYELFRTEYLKANKIDV